MPARKSIFITYIYVIEFFIFGSCSCFIFYKLFTPIHIWSIFHMNYFSPNIFFFSVFVLPYIYFFTETEAFTSRHWYLHKQIKVSRFMIITMSTLNALFVLLFFSVNVQSYCRASFCRYICKRTWISKVNNEHSYYNKLMLFFSKSLIYTLGWEM